MKQSLLLMMIIIRDEHKSMKIINNNNNNVTYFFILLNQLTLDLLFSIREDLIFDFVSFLLNLILNIQGNPLVVFFQQQRKKGKSG